MSGEVARDYARTHLVDSGTDGMGRRILTCSSSDLEWVEEREPSGYGADVTVLRRLTR